MTAIGTQLGPYEVQAPLTAADEALICDSDTALWGNERRGFGRVVDYYRPISWITPLKVAGEKHSSLSVGFFFSQEDLSFLIRSWEINARRGSVPMRQNLFVSLSAPRHQIEADRVEQ